MGKQNLLTPWKTFWRISSNENYPDNLFKKDFRKLLVILLVLSAILLFVSGFSVVSEWTDIQAMVKGNTTFALDLYARLKGGEGNLIFSPYSVSSAFAIAYAGARGNTEKQLAEVFHFALGQDRTHSGMSQIQSDLDNTQKGGEIKLNIANALWIQKNYNFLQEFLNVTQTNYGSVINQTDFIAAYNRTYEEINAWVERQTQNLIRNAISPGSIDLNTRLIIINAIYFKGDWASRFRKEQTKPALFWQTPDNSFKVPMMHQEQEFRYADYGGFQMLELPYEGYNDFALIVLLPKKTGGLSDLENSLNLDKLNQWILNLRIWKVALYLPKFKTEYGVDLTQTLASMGMPDAFDEQANFTGMTLARPLFITVVRHVAFVEVDEQGTKAAAVTYLPFGCSARIPPQGTATFRVDHPFLFFIRHNPSGTILFVGRIVDPRT